MPCNGCTRAINIWKLNKMQLSGCASNLLAHEDLGHLRRPILGIYKPSSIMKIPTSIWKWQYMRDSIWRTWCYFEAQVWKKDSSIAPFYFLFIFIFFSFLYFLGLFFFGLYLFFGTMLYWMMIITLLFIYNSMITTRY